MNRARLLLVDDEVPLLRLMERSLHKAGYEVDSHVSGEEAWADFCGKESAYWAAIVDLSLPDLPGADLVRRLRSARKDFPIIICSGALPDEELNSASGTWFLQKPFLPRMLIESVEEAMEYQRHRGQ